MFVKKHGWSMATQVFLPEADANKPALWLNKGNMDLGLFC